MLLQTIKKVDKCVFFPEKQESKIKSLEKQLAYGSSGEVKRKNQSDSAAASRSHSSSDVGLFSAPSSSLSPKLTPKPSPPPAKPKGPPARYEAGEGENFSDEVKEQQLKDKTAMLERMKGELEQSQREVASLKKEQLKACKMIKLMVQSRNEQSREIGKLKECIAEKVSLKKKS